MKKCFIIIFIIGLIIILGQVSYAEENSESNNNEKIENNNEKVDIDIYDENKTLNDDIDIEENKAKEKNNNVENNMEENNNELDSNDNIDSNFEEDREVHNDEIIKEDEKIQENAILENGEYEIRASEKSDLVLDIQGASLNDGAKLQLWEDIDEAQQRFIIERQDDGYYKISIRKSKKILDVENAGKSENTNVQQYQNNESDAQRWIIKEAGDGTYNIISKCNGLYMTIVGNIQSESKIRLFKYNGECNQKFILDKIIKTIADKTLSDGEYEIKINENNNLVFDIQSASDENEAKLQLWESIDEPQQRFILQYQGDGYYKIECKKSKKVLDVENAKLKENTPVQQYQNNESDAQRWIIKDNKDGTYSIISKCNGLYISTVANLENGCKMNLFKYNTKLTQSFVFKAITLRTIEDGEYEIRSDCDENLVLDIQNASNNNEAKLQLWNDIDEAQQRFYVEYQGDGYYKITVRKSGKLLDVEKASLKEGTSVQQYQNNNLDAQRWIIKDVGDGTYNIISKCNGLYMTIVGNVIPDSKIKLYSQNDKFNQKFVFDKVIKVIAKRTIEDGEYEIRAGSDENLVLDIQNASNNNEAKLQLWNDIDEPQQRFYIEYQGDGYYKITVRKSGKMIDVEKASLKEGTSVQQYQNNNLDAQRWIIKDVGDGTYNIISKCNGLYITIVGNVIPDSKIKLYSQNDRFNQRFIFDKVIKVIATRTIEDGEYEISSSIDNNLIFDIQGASCEDNAKLQLWNNIGKAQQRFYIEYQGNGYYKIKVKKSGKMLDVENGGLKEKTNVQQYYDNGSDAQQWIIYDLGNGMYNIISKCNGLYMSTSDANVKRETKILLKKFQNTSEQSFKFNKIKELYGIDVSSHQGVIDWKNVKESEIDFAIIRAGYRGYGSGALKIDERFYENMKGAYDNNIDYGVYFYSQAINEAEAEEEAYFVINALKGYNIKYNIVIDSEYSTSKRTGRADYLTVNERTKVCKKFCETVEKLGYKSMIYASKSWFYNNLNIDELNKFDTWVAHYTTDKTDYKYDYSIWQYTSKGKVNGINGNVDLDIMYC